MKTLTSAALASIFALGLVGAAAQAQTIPNPTNPTPRFPVATDGSPLPYRGSYEGGLLTGRSAYAPVAAPFDAVVGTGVGAADAGLGIAGGVVNGTAGALGVR